MKTPLLPTTPTHMNSTENPLTSLASQWIIRGVKVAVVIVVALVIVQIGVAIWLRGYMEAPATELVEATGMNAAIAAWLKGIAITVASISLAPWVLRLCVGLTLPGFSSAKTMRLSMLAIAISGVAVCAPPAIRACRTMQSVDPNTSCWFKPDGKPGIAVSLEKDGSYQFWNRPGITPQSGVPAVWVTLQTRSAWEAKQAIERSTKARESAEEAARKGAESRMQPGVKAQAAREESRRNVTQSESLKEQLRTENRQAEGNVPHEYPWQSLTILPGRYLYVRNFPTATLEIQLPVELTIEVEGYRPFLCHTGVSRVAMQGSRGFRVSSMARTSVVIQIRALATR